MTPRMQDTTPSILSLLVFGLGENQTNQSMDQYKNIIETRKDCEKITCAPYPKDPGQSLRIQELVLK